MNVNRLDCAFGFTEEISPAKYHQNNIARNNLAGNNIAIQWYCSMYIYIKIISKII